MGDYTLGIVNFYYLIKCIQKAIKCIVNLLRCIFILDTLTQTQKLMIKINQKIIKHNQMDIYLLIFFYFQIHSPKSKIEGKN